MGNFRKSVADPRHYINQVVDHFGRQTDASFDVHEAYAFLHLSCACQSLRWKYNQMSDISERVNLYMVFLGESGEARKSTAMKLHRGVLDRLQKNGVFFDGEAFTPQGLRDGLAEREGFATLVHFDEMEDIFRAMSTPGSNMGGLPPMLKQLYSSPRYTTKLSKVGKSLKDQEIIIKQSYLCLMGNVTPTIGAAFDERYLTDGMVARITIIKSSHDTKPMSAKDWNDKWVAYDDEILTVQEAQRRWIIDHLESIKNAVSHLDENEAMVGFDDESLVVLDDFEKSVNKVMQDAGDGHVGRPSYERIKSTVTKCAILIAAGRLGGDAILDDRGVTVSEPDAKDAVRFGKKILGNSRHFISLCGRSEEIKNVEYVLKRCKKLSVKTGNVMTAQQINRACKDKMTARQVDLVLHDLVRSGDLTATLSGGKDIYGVEAMRSAVAEFIPPEDDESDPMAVEAPN